MSVYYNEYDRHKAAWLRELIRRDLIAPGEVDERSILNVAPADLTGFTQCHFFAGIGVWSYALRRAGWADDAPVWSGSCPCQPFSVAGARAGFDDERHLWPAWFRLLRECRPRVVFGEQVASKLGLAWIDLVHADLEGAGYAVGAIDCCAASVGAPHIRQRLYFVADSQDSQDSHWRRKLEAQGAGSGRCGFTGSGTAGVALGDASLSGLEGYGRLVGISDPAGRETQERHGAATSGPRGLGDPASERRRETRDEHCRRPAQRLGDTRESRGFWTDADWLPCRDGKARPVEPGTFPLAHGAPARLVRLRGYGDAIVAPLAEAFIRAAIECGVAP